MSLTFITIYKFVLNPTSNNNSNNSNKENTEVRKIISIEVKDEKKELVYDNIPDKDTYSEYIVTEYKSSVNYKFFDDEKSIVGKIYIGDDGYAYITNDNEQEEFKVSNIKFKKLYSAGINYDKAIYTYAISETNKLYIFRLLSNNIKEIKVDGFKTKYDVLDFVNISFDDDISPASHKIFVLESDNNIYEAYSGLRYNKNIKTVFSHLLLFEDNTIANLHGNVLKDKDGNVYKAKYIFYAKPTEDYFEYNMLIIITEDDRFITLLKEDSYGYIYEDPLKVKNVEFDKNMPFMYGNLKVDFGEDKVTFEAKCSRSYCINKFEELKVD